MKLKLPKLKVIASNITHPRKVIDSLPWSELAHPFCNVGHVYPIHVAKIALWVVEQCNILLAFTHNSPAKLLRGFDYTVVP